MDNKALGLIEVRGMLGALLAADAALKAANVELLGNKRIRGGLTTVHLLGDVAAIKAAVEAGENIVKPMNSFVSSHVIPRLDKQVEEMLLKKHNADNNYTKRVKRINETEIKKEKIFDKEIDIHPETIKKIEAKSLTSAKGQLNESVVESDEISEDKYEERISKDKLNKMKVIELRSLAYKRNIKALSKREIKYANKETLIKALMKKGVEDE